MNYFYGVKGNFVFNYVDDLVVYSRSVKEHVVHARTVLQRLQVAGLTLKPDKMNIGARESNIWVNRCHLVVSLSCRIEWQPLSLIPGPQI